LDEVGYWSEVKLEIVRKYAKAYSTILATRPFIKAHLYVDAFAGAGAHISKDKDTGASIAGSPVNAMQITPPFSELHLIDLDGTRVSELRRIASGDARVRVYEGDCNEILLQDVFPRCQALTALACFISQFRVQNSGLAEHLVPKRDLLCCP
jgi:three-Cys-motif partner protein